MVARTEQLQCPVKSDTPPAEGFRASGVHIVQRPSRSSWFVLAVLVISFGASCRPAPNEDQVRRNQERFPADFAFQLTKAEKAEVIADCDHLQRLKFSAVLPLAFTEHGA